MPSPAFWRGRLWSEPSYFRVDHRLAWITAKNHLALAKQMT